MAKKKTLNWVRIWKEYGIRYEAMRTPGSLTWSEHRNARNPKRCIREIERLVEREIHKLLKDKNP